MRRRNSPGECAAASLYYQPEARSLEWSRRHIEGYVMTDSPVSSAGQPATDVQKDDQTSGQLDPSGRPIATKHLSVLTLAEIIAEVDKALPSQPEGGTMAAALVGAINTFRAPADRLRLGDVVWRDSVVGLQGPSIRLTATPTRQGSVWLLRGWSRRQEAEAYLYPLDGEMLVVTRAVSAGVDRPRQAATSAALARIRRHRTPGGSW